MSPIGPEAKKLGSPHTSAVTRRLDVFPALTSTAALALSDVLHRHTTSVANGA